MLHPILDVDDFNVATTFAGLFLLGFGLLSLKIKQRWYLGEALPSFIVGVLLGPVATNLINVSRWTGGSDREHVGSTTYALARLVLGIQMIKVGYELPKRYLRLRLIELTICLLPLMALQWVATSTCIKLMIPNLTFLTSSIIGSCVICIDPVLSQAIAKGPFADRYVRRHLREFISAEAGGNDGFGFPFLMLAIALLRYDDAPSDSKAYTDRDWIGETDTGRVGGDVSRALAHWAVEGVLYMIMMASGYGLFVGFVGRKGLNLASSRKWVDKESFTLFPLAIGLFVVGTCGCFGTDETLACFIAGCAFNWDGRYHAEIEARHDTFNCTLETALNFGTFVYLGAVMPWDQLQVPDLTGITVARLIGLGMLILVFRRIPAILLGYRFMPRVCHDWREALFMGYFAPIGIGAIAYVEYARELLPDAGESDAEINFLTAAMIPVVYWLVFFSIVVHGLSVPTLYGFYRWRQVPMVQDHPVDILLLTDNEPVPNNSVVDRQAHHVTVNNRFSRISDPVEGIDLGNCHRRQSDSFTIILETRSGDRDGDESVSTSPTKESACAAPFAAGNMV
ncbi:Uncharacterized protein PECH_001567 [Penicillium ucsense]|uniref:Cation/H+ exchanger transmembrane domain-containing protein n=1 Tax=Penicillium ucsense TaxID=2839758 RepID=A0A8J8VXK4_9EURO|nr:Uncharacterized protein PECM_001081 [Penicillium ucsense]KAF7732640.1 Uncharacterized protein PECH_001567 [Penicillium ucsense]